MNQTEWKKSDKFPCKYKWYNKTRKLQRSLQYNDNINATVIHHLRDTEDQRAYNDMYYEYWGFNQDGTFEYGKYVIFVTKEEHIKIHTLSEETRQKISQNNKGMRGKCHKRKSLYLMRKARTKQVFSKEAKDKLSAAMTERWLDDAFCNKMKNITSSRSSEENSKIATALWQDDDYRAKQIIAHNWTSSFGWLEQYMLKKEKKELAKMKHSEAMKR